MPAIASRSLRLGALSALCVLAAGPALAAGDADAPVFSGSLYLWGSALKGTTSTLPPLPATDVDLSFRDVLKNFEGGLMGVGEVNAGRWTGILDVMFTQVSPSGTMPGPAAAGVDLRSRSLTAQGDLLYRVYESDAVRVDAGAGLRFWHLDNRLSIGGGALPQGITYSQSQAWIDPVAVARLSTRLGDAWSATLIGDLGGFNVGSRFTWQAIGTVNYHWTEKVALRLGYRVLSVDYENGAFLYDVRMQGPVAGLTYRF